MNFGIGKSLVIIQTCEQNGNYVNFGMHSQLSQAVELTHLVVKWSAVRNQSEIETSLKMRGMSPFLFVKLVQQRRTQNHAKPAHRVRRSSSEPLTGTTRSAGVGGFGLALAILVGLAQNGVAPHSYIFPVNHFSRPK